MIFILRGPNSKCELCTSTKTKKRYTQTEKHAQTKLVVGCVDAADAAQQLVEVGKPGS